MPTKSLATANVVITANTFNMSIFNQLWLERNGIFTENELTSPDNAFVPVFVQVAGQTCHLLVVPERLQVTFKDPEDPEPVLDKVRNIVGLLPETPYTALGLNAMWFLSMDDGDTIPGFTRRNFAVPGRALFNYFRDDGDSKFGTYVSKSFGDFRLRGDFKPVTVIGTDEEKVQLSFNFNLDFLPGVDNVPAIRNALTRWTEAFQETKTIMDMLT
jgi:hypothetical protein